MRLLLDTHALVWAALEPARLSDKARSALEDGGNEVFVSAVTAFEIATKVRKGAFDSARPLSRRFAAQVTQRGFALLSITPDHGELAGNLEIAHRDPWDRLLIAQARVENLLLVTCDTAIGDAGVPTFW